MFLAQTGAWRQIAEHRDWNQQRYTLKQGTRGLNVTPDNDLANFQDAVLCHGGGGRWRLDWYLLRDRLTGCIAFTERTVQCGLFPERLHDALPLLIAQHVKAQIEFVGTTVPECGRVFMSSQGQRSWCLAHHYVPSVVQLA